MFKRTNMNKFLSQFKILVEAYLSRRNISSTKLADMIGIDKSHLSNLLTGKRVLSAHYLAKFIMGGIFTVDDLTKGQDVIADTAGEKRFWSMAKAFECGTTLEKIATMKSWGVDVDAKIDRMFMEEVAKREK